MNTYMSVLGEIKEILDEDVKIEKLKGLIGGVRMNDSYIWYDMDVSEAYRDVCDFFAKWGYNTTSTTEGYAGIDDIDSLLSRNHLQASCIEDVPDEIVIAVQGNGNSGQKLVLRPTL